MMNGLLGRWCIVVWDNEVLLLRGWVRWDHFRTRSGYWIEWGKGSSRYMFVDWRRDRSGCRWEGCIFCFEKKEEEGWWRGNSTHFRWVQNGLVYLLTVVGFEWDNERFLCLNWLSDIPRLLCRCVVFVLLRWCHRWGNTLCKMGFKRVVLVRRRSLIELGRWGSNRNHGYSRYCRTFSLNKEKHHFFHWFVYAQRGER